MPASKKGKRKVNVKGKQYLWYVNDSAPETPQVGFVEHQVPERYLHIISTDKRFIVRYRIPVAGDPHTELYIDGPVFPRAPELREVEVPRWRHDTKRYPTGDFVRCLIAWCMEEDMVS
jgi:hypothetical protein